MKRTPGSEENRQLWMLTFEAADTHRDGKLLGGACLKSLVVGLDINGTILQGDTLNGTDVQEGLTEPAREFILRLNALESRIVFFTFGQDWKHAINCVKELRQAPVAHKFFIARHAVRLNELWAFRLDDPPCSLINWQAKNPALVFNEEEYAQRAPLTFDEDQAAECYRLIGVSAYESFVTRLLTDGDIVLRAAFDPQHERFRGRKACCGKLLAVTSEMPILVFDDHPEDWKVPSPHVIVKATTPSNAKEGDEATDFCLHLATFALQQVRSYR